MTSLIFITCINFKPMCLYYFFIVYFVLGLLCSMFFEFLIYKFKNEGMRNVSWNDRFWYMHFWPSFLAFFLFSVFKAVNDAKKKIKDTDE